MREQFGLCASFVTVGLLLGSPAFAQDAATAGALFDKGVSDMQAEHFDSACPAIEESQQLDPHPGTLFTLAECQAKWGKVASAVAHYQDYIGVVSRLPADQQARHRDRVAIANAQLGKLKGTVPTLTLVLPTDAPSGATVTRNGVALQGAALGLALPVDPGEYSIVTRAPGGKDHSVSVKVALGETKRVELEILAPESARPAAPSGQTETGGAATSAPDTGAPSHTAAYVVGGIGVAGVIVGSVAGILVFGKKSTVSSDCNGTSCKTDTGVNAANSGKSLGIVSDVGFGVGIAGLATATILLLASPKSEQASRAVAPHWEPLLAGTPGGAWAGLGRRW